MKDYVKQLEEQNEQLQKKLANCEEFTLKWVEEAGPWHAYRNSYYDVAHVYYSALKKIWKVDFMTCPGYEPYICIDAFDTPEEAKEYVEETLRSGTLVRAMKF